MVCKRCGFQNPDNARCCCNCGKNLQENRKKNDIWIPIAAVIVLTGIISTAIMFVIPKKKEGWYVNEAGYHSFYIDNKMATGMHTIEGKQYFFDDQGIMHEGLLQLNGKRYFFNDDGVMQSGFVQIKEEKIQAMLPDGEMGWIKQELDSTYFFNDNGAAVTGWQTIDGNQYYFDQDGKMAIGQVKLGEHYYFFREDGTMVTGEFQLNQKCTAYYDKDGIYQYHVITETPEQKLSSDKVTFTDSHGKSTVHYVVLDKPVKDGISMTGTVELTGSNYTKSDGEWAVYIRDKYGRWNRKGYFYMDGPKGSFEVDLSGTEEFTKVACARHGNSYSTRFVTTVDTVTYYG